MKHDENLNLWKNKFLNVGTNMKFNNVEITQESFNKAKQFYIELSNELIRQVVSKELKVNDPEQYIKDRKNHIDFLKNMKVTSNFTILQRAYFEQTGDMMALLK